MGRCGIYIYRNRYVSEKANENDATQGCQTDSTSIRINNIPLAMAMQTCHDYNERCLMVFGRMCLNEYYFSIETAKQFHSKCR